MLLQLRLLQPSKRPWQFETLRNVAQGFLSFFHFFCLFGMKIYGIDHRSVMLLHHNNELACCHAPASAFPEDHPSGRQSRAVGVVRIFMKCLDPY
ncbi:hypothetical protein [Herbaspirillum lusitanum]|uniref:hypothetical protein n=1 Tax=Herbaspirillum lusitanum TaxID=213312 RepID=UPI001389F3B7|nr:hypothetical protein [Herbaspirillum lusitanum]